MKSIRSSCLLALCTALIACNTNQTASPALTAQTKQPATVSSASLAARPVTSVIVGTGPTQGKRAVSALQNLLHIFAAEQAASWSSFDTVPGVRWRDSKPLENPDSTTPDTTHYRSGNLLLLGFGEVDVPDGKVGADAGTRKDNEGDVGVTLNGDSDSVQTIALLKFYPSGDYAQIMQQQFGTNATIKLVADQCALDYGTTATNSQKNTFYQIMFGAAIPIYVEAYIDEGGGNQGPGTTTFVFYTNKPAQRMAAMHCKEN